jgi:hypothetical protein
MYWHFISHKSDSIFFFRLIAIIKLQPIIFKINIREFDEPLPPYLPLVLEEGGAT